MFVPPSNVPALFEKALALHRDGRLEQANVMYALTAQAADNDAKALAHLGAAVWMQWGLCLKALGQLELAVEKYDRAIQIGPQLAAAHFNRANALRALTQHAAAVADYRAALRIDPGLVNAYANYGNLLNEMRQYSDAVEQHSHVVRLAPKLPQGFLNRGLALHQLGEFERAIRDLDVALGLNPDLAEAHIGRGNALLAIKQHEQAAGAFERALMLSPQRPFLLGLLMNTNMQVCQWRGLAPHLSLLESGVAEGQPVSSPPTVLGLLDSPRLQRRAAEIWAAHNRLTQPVPARNEPAGRGAAPSGRIRVGYYSADFHNHATMHLMAGLFEAHDRSRFEIVAFSFGPDRQDSMRQRVASAFDQFLDVANLGDDEVALTSRQMGIDIAVDLKGYTQDSRPGLFASRCAAVQVSYLGFPGTMGAGFMDYLVADAVLVPEHQQAYYAEKIVYMPHSYQVNDNSRSQPGQSAGRASAGLPADDVVFCCFNNNYKITPEVFDSWARILGSVHNSVLWLLADNPAAAANLSQEAAARRMDPDRIVFAPRAQMDEHINRHQLADLFLDTWPCNAHTTASDALWAGLPVLTRTGDSFASRVAASLLTAAGLPELVVDSEETYVALAIELGRDAERLRSMKAQLVRNRQTMPLFDTPLFTRHLEQAYEQMHQRSMAGLPPDHLTVLPSTATEPLRPPASS